MTIALSLTSCADIWGSSSSLSNTVSPDSSFNESSSSGEDSPFRKAEMSYSIEDYVKNSYWTLSSCPTSGSPKILIVPIWFTNSSSVIDSEYKDLIRSDIDTAFLGSEEDTGWHSVTSYYNELSKGELNITGVVTDWYECGYSISRVGSDSSYTDTIIKEATDWYFNNNPDEKRTDFDYDNDGYMDGIMAIYAAPDYGNAAYYQYDNLWAYCYWLETDANKLDPQPNVYFWSSYDFMYGYDSAYSRTGKYYFGGDTNHCTIDAHTFIHEFGHVLGLEDYYDYSGQYVPAGGFSMQDQNIGSHDPYSVMTMGWADPYIPNESCTIEIGAFQKTNELILLAPEWNEYDSPFDEYLLLELYTPTGLNELDATYSYMMGYPLGPSSTGIRLWHVDARLYDCATRNTLITNPEMSGGAGVLKAMTNTYYERNNADIESYLSPLGRAYYDYNELQLIRNSSSTTYHPTGSLENADLFLDGDSFSMSAYSKQFVNGTNMNSGIFLGWEFSVSINGSGHDAVASITCTKMS